jgi:hypothetical protein
MSRKGQTLYESDLPGEEWASAFGYDGLYEVSNMGRVKSLSRYVERPQGSYWTKVRILSPGKIIHKNLDGSDQSSLFVQLTDAWGQTSNRTVSRLVISSFRGHTDLAVDHIDGISTNNQLSNLRYMSNSEKMIADYGRGQRGMSREACSRLGGYRRAIINA